MGIIDARLHSEPGSAAPKELLRQMNHIGVNGGGISSPDPENPVRGSGYFYEVRMEAMGA